MLKLAGALTLAILVLGAPTVQAAGPMEWMPPRTLDDQDSLRFEAGTDVSCPSASFCAAVDLHGNLLISQAPATGVASAWETFEIDGVDEDRLVGISCPSASFCAAVAKDGAVVTSTDPDAGPLAWSRAQVPAASEMTTISCASASLCVAGNETGELFTSSDPTGGASAWNGVAIPGALRFQGISCPTASFCAAVDVGDHDDSGNWESEIYTTTAPTGGAGGWKPEGVTAYGTSPALSCASEDLCVAAFGQGILASDEPGGGAAAWSFADLGERLNLVSCPSEGFCAAVDNGMDHTWTSTEPLGGAAAWSSTDTSGLDLDTRAISCSGSDFCAALTWVGDVATSVEPDGGAETWEVAVTGGFDGFLADVSCPTASFCATIDSNGNAFFSEDPLVGASWDGYTLSSRYLHGISCSGPSFCAVLGSGGKLLVSTDPTSGPGAWQESAFGGGTLDISCPSASFCAVVRGDEVLTSTEPTTAPASTWAATDLQLGDEYLGPNHLSLISCPSASFCAVSGTTSMVLASADPTGGKSTWVKSWVGNPLPGGNPNYTPPASDVSCADPAFCAAAWRSTVSVTSAPLANPVAWERFDVTGGKGPGSLSCPSASFCLGTAGSHVLPSPGVPPSGSGWGRPELLDESGSLRGVSCDPGLSVCAVVNGSGQVFVGIPDPDGFFEEEEATKEGSGTAPSPGPAPAPLPQAAPHPRACKAKHRRGPIKGSNGLRLGQARAVAGKRRGAKARCRAQQRR